MTDPSAAAPVADRVARSLAEAARLETAGDAAGDDRTAAAAYEQALWLVPTRPLFAKLVAAVDRLRAADPGYLFVTHTLSRPLRVVAAANAAYVPLLETMLASVRFLRNGPCVRFTILDVGLEPEQAGRLRADGMAVVEPEWHLPPGYRTTNPAHFKAMTARPHLPAYAPDAGLILWIDADIWVQTPASLDDIVLGALSGAMAIVPERHRAYNLKFFPLGEAEPIDEGAWLTRLFTVAFGPDEARDLREKPILNTGVFALRARAPHWAAWQASLDRALRRTGVSLVEQTALNHAVYRNGLPTVRFGAHYNWVTHRARPLFDPPTRRFLEPARPFRPLGLIHVTGPDKFRPRPIRTTDGRVIDLPLMPVATDI
ncbi:hypothetical protein [Azospirillum halopraeferens]|uniref:hypothetical protein n=1 Tax=Azospirillum halopraeferens TaxID=34010 RepID=UPI00041AA3A5|nr:hypothetical protein [Azospirillum halopraeferens]